MGQRRGKKDDEGRKKEVYTSSSVDNVQSSFKILYRKFKINRLSTAQVRRFTYVVTILKMKLRLF